MRATTLLIILFFIQASFSQSRYEKDSIQAYALIKDKVKQLDKEGVSKSILIYDSSGKLLLIWKEHKKYRAIGTYYRDKDTSKFKSYRLTKKNKSDINQIIANPEMLNKVTNLDCDTEVYSFTKISVDINNTEFSGSFFSNCPQNESLKPLKALYFNLFRDR